MHNYKDEITCTTDAYYDSNFDPFYQYYSKMYQKKIWMDLPKTYLQSSEEDSNRYQKSWIEVVDEKRHQVKFNRLVEWKQVKSCRWTFKAQKV